MSAGGSIRDMIMIAERPAEADDRAVPGHWEGDLIIGKGGRTPIGTLVERTTRFCCCTCPRDSAETVARRPDRQDHRAARSLRRSLTWDQGNEMALHASHRRHRHDIYFCDPHSPWQRGTNENTNGLLRQYFPKGTDLSFYGPSRLDQVAAELNADPANTRMDDTIRSTQ